MSTLEKIDAEIARLETRKRQLSEVSEGNETSVCEVNGDCVFGDDRIYLYPVERLIANSGVVLNVEQKYAIHVLFFYLQYSRSDDLPTTYEATVSELRWMLFACDHGMRAPMDGIDMFVKKLQLIFQSLGKGIDPTGYVPRTSIKDVKDLFRRVERNIKKVLPERAK